MVSEAPTRGGEGGKIPQARAFKGPGPLGHTPNQEDKNGFL